MQAVITEFPAGKLDTGEDGLACAQRELREETGYSAREWAYAGQLAPTIAYSDERIGIWFARGLTLGDRHLDDGEFLDVFTAPPDQVMGWCRDGTIIDGKTLVGMLWLQNVLSGKWALEWHGAQARPAGDWHEGVESSVQSAATALRAGLRRKPTTPTSKSGGC